MKFNEDAYFLKIGQVIIKFEEIKKYFPTDLFSEVFWLLYSRDYFIWRTKFVDFTLRESKCEGFQKLALGN